MAIFESKEAFLVCYYPDFHGFRMVCGKLAEISVTSVTLPFSGSTNRGYWTPQTMIIGLNKQWFVHHKKGLYYTARKGIIATQERALLQHNKGHYSMFGLTISSFHNIRRKSLAGRTSQPCSRRGLSSMETTMQRQSGCSSLKALSPPRCLS